MRPQTETLSKNYQKLGRTLEASDSSLGHGLMAIFCLDYHDYWIYLLILLVLNI